MKIEKLPSGSYRIRKMYKGKTYTVVTEYKPTQKEALKLMAEELDRIQTEKVHITFDQAAKQYIDTKENVLSPSTIRMYTTIKKNINPQFSGMLLSDIKANDIQKEINHQAKTKCAKTVRNYHGFISAVLGMFSPNTLIRTTLPQRHKNEPYIPSDDEVKQVLNAAKGTKYEIPLLLGCYGMRRSEICALTLDDIDGDVIRINKALVQDKNKNWVIKYTKTTASEREIVVPQKVIDLIQEQGFVFKGYPNTISLFLKRTTKELGITYFSLHKLRHYFASKMSALGCSEEDILKMGGWESDYVMKNVYRHALADKNLDRQRNAANLLGNNIL